MIGIFKQDKLKPIREKASKIFEAIDSHSMKSGIGIYTNQISLNLEKIAKKSISKNKIKIESDPKIKIIDLSSMSVDYINDFMQSLFSPSEDKLSALHYTLLNDAVALIIPKGEIIEKPIIIKSNTDSENKAESIIIIAEEGSKANIFEISESTAENTYKSQSVLILAKENSEVNYHSLQALNENTHNYVIKRAEVSKDARVNWIDLALGSRFTHLKMDTKLTEHGASTKEYGAFFGNEMQLFEIYVQSMHLSENTDSAMMHRGVLQDEAKCNFRSNINIAKDSKNSNGRQKSDVLLIGDNSKCDAVPTLEVYNDQVNCSHGVTMGQLDPEQIFYLLSRGLDEDSAKQMIILGFFEPILNEIRVEEIRNNILQIINDKIMAVRLPMEMKNAE